VTGATPTTPSGENDAIACPRTDPPTLAERIAVVLEYAGKGYGVPEIYTAFEPDLEWIRQRYGELRGKHSFNHAANISRIEWVERVIGVRR
jgi:hypothetical protein